MAEVEHCPFCNIGDRVLRENDLAQVFLSQPRKTYGHFLVVPKRHIEKPWDLTPEELQAIFELIFFVQSKIIPKLGDGCDIRQNYRPYMLDGKIKVAHTHFHVIPRSENDRINEITEQYDKDLFQPLEPGEHDEIAALLT